MLYKLAKPVLLSMPAELSHELSLQAIMRAGQMGISLGDGDLKREVEVMGLTFKNPVGLAAGLDKNGDCIDGMAKLGFGFIEIGTITPKPQPGNPKPRLFREQSQMAIVNRMGFNNKGVDHLVAQVKKANYDGILGINIGKNKNTPIENAADDYIHCLQKVYEHASYVTVNISSPNTPDLRSLQHGDSFRDFVSQLKDEQQKLDAKHQRRVPMVVKIAPDLDDEEMDSIVETLVACEVEGLIISNTTSDKSQLKDLALQKEAGGLSGAPLMAKATQVQQQMSDKLQGRIPIIGVGGICSAEDAQAKQQAGASLVQIYTGMIYQGPELIADIVRRWSL